MVKMFIKELRAHPFTIIIFIVGFLISNLIISIGISTATNIKYMQIEKREGYDKNSLQGEITYSNLNISHEEIIDNFNVINEKTRITLNEIYGEIENKLGKEEVEIINDIFKKDKKLYPVIEGDFYTVKDIENREKVVVIGQDLKKYVYEKDNNKYIKISGEEFEVIGVIGKKNEKSVWDRNVFMPLTVVPKKCKNQYVRHISQYFTISNEDMKTIEEVARIKEKILLKDNTVRITLSELEKGKDIYGSIGESNFFRIGIAILIIAIINVINISSFWIDDRKEEFAIRKAFGIDNIRIIGILFLEIVSIIIFSTVLALIFQNVLANFITENIVVNFNLYFENIIAGIFISVIAAMITLILPIYKIYKLEPVKILRGE